MLILTLTLPYTVGLIFLYHHAAATCQNHMGVTKTKTNLSNKLGPNFYETKFYEIDSNLFFLYQSPAQLHLHTAQ